MKQIFSYIRAYFTETHKPTLVVVSILTAILVFLNYHFLIDDRIDGEDSFAWSFWGRVVIFSIAFILPYLVYRILAGRNYFTSTSFILLLLIAPFIFALKIALNIPIQFSEDYGVDNYWNHIVYWPLLLLITAILLLICWRIFNRDQPFYGVTTKNLVWKPYLIMLLIMVPLIAAASTQPDFLRMYPKINSVIQHGDMQLTFWHKLLFELSYGSDFISIELFFRGFLILAFVKWAGKDAILPMACFYCTIHFGKPLAECISSYFGGILLGIVVYNTRSIFEGLLVHLGIAWMMEVGGYLGG